MRLAITGATGLIGQRLTDFFLAHGHQVSVLTRGRSYPNPKASVIVWDPMLSYIEPQELEGFDVVIHLAGANVGEYWTPAYKKEILESRVLATRLLSDILSQARSKPRLLISASAVGFYGSHPASDVVDETSPAGRGFLAEVCQKWEKETVSAAQAGIRVVHMRLGVVLSKSGGALAKMWTPFQFGVGGVLGSGQQMTSWVAADEIPYVVDYLIKNERIVGPVNVTAPKAVSNREFTEMLGRAMHRPTMLPVPAFAVRLMFGEMGQSLLLEGACVAPRRLQENGYQSRFVNLQETLEKICH
jgi:uncharacterized protein (TIGR01777 family)